MTPIHTGPDVPHRTSRKRALEIGTTPEGFEDGVTYCAQCGHPVTVGSPCQHATVQEPAIEAGPSPMATTPFAVKE